MVVGYCRKHEEKVDKQQFEYKGCWTCWSYFERTDEWPYCDVKQAAEKLEVSKTTVRNWIKNGKLDGRLFERGRNHPDYRSDFPNKKYFIRQDSVEELAA